MRLSLTAHKMAKKTLYTLTSIIAVVAVWLLMQHKTGYLLVADVDLQVSENPMHIADEKPLGTISKYQKIPLTGCIDLKHYLVPRVLLFNGKQGYVQLGEFHFVDANTLARVGWPIHLCS
jgi:hypothetical protein